MIFASPLNVLPREWLNLKVMLCIELSANLPSKFISSNEGLSLCRYVYSGVCSPRQLQMKIDLNPHHPFSLFNIPFGIGSSNGRCFVASRVADLIIDVAKMAEFGYFECCSFAEDAIKIFSSNYLNGFMELGPIAWSETRKIIQESIKGVEKLSDEQFHCIFLKPSNVKLELPINIGDYTDFYASKDHAMNVGTMFRGKDNALMPNWSHMPIGYHGRASSIVVSGTPVIRPHGQVKKAAENPEFSISEKLDFELEIGFVIGKGNELGTTITTETADDHIFGIVLLNDWSARDIQAWEYVPLGPFLGKNFCTTISPWIITLEALRPFLVVGPPKDTPLLPYLEENCDSAYDIELTVTLSTENSHDVVSKTNLRHMYWSFKQQLAHHTINGCNMRTGDLCDTGTISGPTADSYGSMLELSWNGKQPIILSDGSSRSFLHDGDEIILKGLCKNTDFSIGLGECIGKIQGKNQNI